MGVNPCGVMLSFAGKIAVFVGEREEGKNDGKKRCFVSFLHVANSVVLFRVSKAFSQNFSFSIWKHVSVPILTQITCLTFVNVETLEFQNQK